MPSRHLVDPEMTSLIEQFAEVRFEVEALPAIRAFARARRPAPGVEGVDVSERFIPGADGDPPVRLVITQSKARGADRPGILHIHGGGYVIGAPEMDAATQAAYVAELGAVVVSVDYRLAPETQHPGPLNDCYAALAWMHAHATTLGLNRRRIAISGESAGGGLAAATTLLARDRGELCIAFQHLIFPMLDDRTGAVLDPSPFVGQFVWTRAGNQFGWASLLGRTPGGPDISPYAAPARATDLSGLPQTFIACGALDLFLDEDMDYARRLIHAGVPTELVIYPGAPHGFPSVEASALAARFKRDSLAAFKRALEL